MLCALTNGGGYADYCLVPAPQCVAIPKGLTFIEAASLPEVFFTAWNNIMWLGRLAEGESLLIQGGTSGVGMAGIQIARHLRNATVYATAGSEEKRHGLPPDRGGRGGRLSRRLGQGNPGAYRRQGR